MLIVLGDDAGIFLVGTISMSSVVYKLSNKLLVLLCRGKALTQLHFWRKKTKTKTGSRRKRLWWAASPNTVFLLRQPLGTSELLFSSLRRLRCRQSCNIFGKRHLVVFGFLKKEMGDRQLGRACWINMSLWNFKSVLLWLLSRWLPLEVWHLSKSWALPQHFKRNKCRKNSGSCI